MMPGLAAPAGKARFCATVVVRFHDANDGSGSAAVSCAAQITVSFRFRGVAEQQTLRLISATAATGQNRTDADQSNRPPRWVPAPGPRIGASTQEETFTLAADLIEIGQIRRSQMGTSA